MPTAPETQQVVIVLTKIGGSPSLKGNQVEPNVNSGCNPRHLWRSSELQITIDGHIVNTDRGHVYPGCSFVPQSGAGSCGDRIILTDGKGGRTVRSLICRHLCGIPKHPALSFCFHGVEFKLSRAHRSKISFRSERRQESRQ